MALGRVDNCSEVVAAVLRNARIFFIRWACLSLGALYLLTVNTT